MSARYAAVAWNRHKVVYDVCVALAIAGYLGVFFGVAMLLPDAGAAPDPAVTLIRASGTGAMALLVVILCIGPLARLDTRLLPLLYNRRHLGVATFLLALVHAAVVVGYYHGFGAVSPLVSLLVNSTRSGAGFELFGVAALAILFVMAATSHDFWLKNLTPRMWKSIHMTVYLAFALLVAHVAFGALQSERSVAYPALLGVAIAMVGGLHVAAGLREGRRIRETDATDAEWIDAGPWREIHESRAMIVCPRGAERVAIFRHRGALSAVSNVCAHQQGPLGEGRVIDGCITCPWHGYQYRPHDGQSPPPFTEKIATYQLRIEGERVLLDPRPNAPGTPVEPLRVPEDRP